MSPCTGVFILIQGALEFIQISAPCKSETMIFHLILLCIIYAVYEAHDYVIRDLLDIHELYGFGSFRIEIAHKDYLLSLWSLYKELSHLKIDSAVLSPEIDIRNAVVGIVIAYL